mgnify:CR=1 FL=1
MKYIDSFKEGEGINDIYLVKSKKSDVTKTGKPYDKLVLATTTFNSEIFPFMREFIESLTERNYQNRRLAFIENGSWAPQAAKVMKGMLEGCKNMTYCENGVKIVSALNDESRAQIDALADELAAAYK